MVDDTFNFIQTNLDEYFHGVRTQCDSPKAMLVAVESILQNDLLAMSGRLSAIRGLRGEDAARSYQIEAIEQFHKGHAVWQLEGDAMRRWANSRKTDFTLHEVFWINFLHQYVGASNNCLVDMLTATFNQHPNIEGSIPFYQTRAQDAAAGYSMRLLCVNMMRQAIERLNAF